MSEQTEPNPARMTDGLAMRGLLVLAIIASLYFARMLVLPIVLAVLLTFLLRPLVRALQRVRVPEALGAAAVVLGVVVLLGAGINAAAGPVAEMVQAAPERLRSVETRLRELRRPMDDVGRATRQVERIALGESSAPAATAPPPAPVRESLADALLDGTRVLLVQAVLVLFLLYFLLASGDALAAKLSHLTPSQAARDQVMGAARAIEREISRYLMSVTLINAGEGLAVGLLAWGVGLSTPLAWGVVAGVMNYIPFLGGMLAATAMTLTALATLPLEQALIVPAGYLLISSIEGYLVTPLIVGRRLRLDPVMVLLALIFWGWLWGMPGTLVAVPLLAMIKIACDHVPSLNTVSSILSLPPRGGARRERADGAVTGRSLSPRR